MIQDSPSYCLEIVTQVFYQVKRELCTDVSDGRYDFRVGLLLINFKLGAGEGRGGWFGSIAKKT